MTFTMLLFFLIATPGLTNIMVHGKIMDVIGLRPWLKKHMSAEWFQLFECYECSGFWAGLACGFLLWPTNHFLPLWTIPLWGFAGSITSAMVKLVSDWIESKIEFVVGPIDANQTSDR